MYAIRSYYVAAFTLLRDKKGREAMVEYFQAYAEIAAKNKLGFVLEGMTWRASSAWGENRITSYNVCYTKLLRNPLIRQIHGEVTI